MKNYKYLGYLGLLGIFIFSLSGCQATSKPTADKALESKVLDPGSSPTTANKTAFVATECHTDYRVQFGDTLSGIAVKCKVKMQDLAIANHIMPPYRIKAGQTLTIPSSHQTAQQKWVEKQTKMQVKTHWHWPMNKSIKYAYIADLEGRYAIEFYPELGRPIRSVDSGVVVYAGDAMAHYGKMLVIRHDNHYLTVYAHNRVLKVKKDDQVQAGQIIAYSGQTGDTKVPKLYFEARYLGRKVDVRSLLKPPS